MTLPLVNQPNSSKSEPFSDRLTILAVFRSLTDLITNPNGDKSRPRCGACCHMPFSHCDCQWFGLAAHDDVKIRGRPYRAIRSDFNDALTLWPFVSKGFAFRTLLEHLRSCITVDKSRRTVSVNTRPQRSRSSAMNSGASLTTLMWAHKFIHYNIVPSINGN